MDYRFYNQRKIGNIDYVIISPDCMSRVRQNGACIHPPQKSPIRYTIVHVYVTTSVIVYNRKFLGNPVLDINHFSFLFPIWLSCRFVAPCLYNECSYGLYTHHSTWHHINVNKLWSTEHLMALDIELSGFFPIKCQITLRHKPLSRFCITNIYLL